MLYFKKPMAPSLSYASLGHLTSVEYEAKLKVDQHKNRAYLFVLFFLARQKFKATANSPYGSTSQ